MMTTFNHNLAAGAAALLTLNAFGAEIPPQTGRFANSTVPATQKTGVLPSPIAHEHLPAGVQQTAIFAVVRPDGKQINHADASDWVFHLYREGGLDTGNRAVHQLFGSGNATLSYRFDDSLKAYAPAEYKGTNATFLVVDFVPSTAVAATANGYIAVEDNKQNVPGPHTFNVLIGPFGSPIYNANWVGPQLTATIRDVGEGRVNVEAVNANPQKPVDVLASASLNGPFRFIERFDPRKTTGVVVEKPRPQEFFRLKQD